MKKVIIVFCTALLSLSVYAGTAGTTGTSTGAGASSQRGPWVDCQYPDGSMDYIPDGICRQKGGVRKY